MSNGLKVYNATARLVCKAKKSDFIHLLPKSLRWLPETPRIQRKNLNHLFQSSVRHSPSVSVRSPLTLRASRVTAIHTRFPHLLHPSCERRNIWSKIFSSYTGPSVWGNLLQPSSLSDSFSSFKTGLRGPLFENCFNNSCLCQN